MTIKLDKIDRQIIYELDKNCRISDNQLAKKVNRTREAIRQRIKKLQKEKVILGFITSINPSKFGYTFYKLYFQLKNKPKEREKFYNYMSKIPGMYWLGGNDGVWDFHTTMYAKNIKEINKIKNEIFTEFRELIIKRDVGILVNVRQYPKRYLLEENKDNSEPTIFADDIINNQIDQLDKKLLNILAQNARTSLIELAQKTNSTVDIIRNRIKKLEKKKIILQYRVAIDHTKLGFEMFKAFIYFNNLSEKDEKRLFEYSKQNKNIIYLIRQLSAWDVELELMAKNYQEFSNIMNELRKEFDDVIRNYEFCLMKEDIWTFGDKEILLE
jgi:DNA-binding Lrp family transcriptional regulator